MTAMTSATIGDGSGVHGDLPDGLTGILPSSRLTPRRLPLRTCVQRGPETALEIGR